ncbi:hypothetical protein NEHOM01_0858 [Nematocida homosporus]|uniref:uncharacterized protein n=1 Tax=Nematocida homosporus TaxID=1912981 RepID=UPI00221F60D5|nr:uncharacterized protein NEHOM01_0858 [Nematocida homosporus]KAI5185499.1 hypothetical protein NEHOM01_0858 [Nematocida homosporus]
MLKNRQVLMASCVLGAGIAAVGLGWYFIFSGGINARANEIPETCELMAHEHIGPKPCEASIISSELTKNKNDDLSKEKYEDRRTETKDVLDDDDRKPPGSGSIAAPKTDKSQGQSNYQPEKEEDKKPNNEEKEEVNACSKPNQAGKDETDEGFNSIGYEVTDDPNEPVSLDKSYLEPISESEPFTKPYGRTTPNTSPLPKRKHKPGPIPIPRSKEKPLDNAVLPPKPTPSPDDNALSPQNPNTKPAIEPTFPPTFISNPFTDESSSQPRQRKSKPNDALTK